ncbi:hypothetical protein V8F20_003707 [Naviculisporaceae sp. PSN 640]
MPESVAMQPSQGAPDAPEISDTIVVGGDYSDESQSQEVSDDSFDAYDEDNEGQEQKSEAEAGNDDYARTFDSPAEQDQQVAADPVQPDVSKDRPESMHSSSTPDSKIKSESPVIKPATSVQSPRPEPASVNGAVQPSPSSPSRHTSPKSPSEPLSAPNASPSPTRSPAKSPRDETEDGPAHAPSPGRSPIPATDGIDLANEVDDDAATVDIQKLVEDIAARAATPSPPASPGQATLTSQAAPASSLNLSHHASLPPKPVVSQQSSHLPSIPQPHPFETRSHNNIPPPASPMSHANSATPRGGYMSVGAPGTANEAVSSLPPIPPPTSYNTNQPAVHPLPPNVHPIPGASDASLHQFHASSNQQEWETFMADEKRYTSEAKWDRFPDGSRIFIGNLSSERVSKREVFNVFHKFGRLAQISLKSAFGFVQYHTAEEGQVAIQHAQGIEMGGRKIHLEVSRAKKKEERNRSPDRRDSRGGRNDRYEGRDPNWRRDDYRPGRSPSPRRNDARNGNRDGFYSRDRDSGPAYNRRRSRSPPPPRFSKFDNDSYRRRSPSPHRRASVESDQLDIPRRYGNDIPDVQLLLLQEVERDFVGWVQRAFNDRGLKTDVMFLNPRFPRDALVRRQVLEGVHAIVDLDYAAQAQGKLSIQVFSRSGGSNVRFESYQGIDPTIAAELVLREKSKPIISPVQPQVPYQHVPQYGSGYPADPAAGYPYPYPHPHPQAPPPAIPSQPAAPPAADLASMVGQLDNNALQALLASLQTNQTIAPHQHAMPGYPAAGAQAPQVDVNLLLGNLRNAAASQPAVPPAAQGYGHTPGYMSAGAAGPVSPTGPGVGAAPNAAIVQTIMDQLKRAAQ